MSDDSSNQKVHGYPNKLKSSTPTSSYDLPHPSRDSTHSNATDFWLLRNLVGFLVMWRESNESKLGIEEPRYKEFRYLFQISPLTSALKGLFYSRCTNDIQFMVPGAKKIEGEWRKAAKTISKEFKKVLQGIKKKGYEPLAYGGNPFEHRWVNAVLRVIDTVFVSSASIYPSVIALFAPNTSAYGDAPAKTPTNSIKIMEANQEEGIKRGPILLASPNFLRSLSGTVSLNKGKGLLKVEKISAPSKKKALVESEEEVMKAFWRYCPIGGLASLSLVFAGEVVMKGSTFVAEFVVSFQEELRLSEVRKVLAESQVSQLKRSMFHFVDEKRKSDEALTAVTREATCWKHEYEKELHTSTCRAY
ncbi:hypothetical protein Q3G72_031758 [Acer saccharum]|nr:hypothetical protein Q3G72_031758 [Acer saccharum]